MLKWCETWIVVIGVLVVACGDNDGPAGMNDSPDAMLTTPDAAVPGACAPALPTGPTATILFPPRKAFTYRDSILVRGISQDDGSVVAVAVNGVAANVVDGAWQVAVPLQLGEANELLVTVEDDDGNVTACADGVVVGRSKTLFDQGYQELAVDGAAQRAYITDAHFDEVLELDLTTGLMRVLADNATSADSLGDPRAIDVDPVGDRVVVANTSGVLVGIDTTNGATSELSGPNVGSGPALMWIFAVDVDPSGTYALLLEGGLDAIVRVELATGDRTVISGPGVGTGPGLDSAGDLALDAASQRAWVIGPSSLYVVDLATGNRTAIATWGQETPRDLALNSTSGEPLVVTAQFEEFADRWSLYRVDPVSGTPSLIASEFGSNTLAGTGVRYNDLSDVAFDSTSGHAVVWDSQLSLPIVTDLATGHRRLPWSHNGGQKLIRPYALLVAPANNRAWVSDRGSSSVVEVDLATGAQTIVSDDVVGGGADMRIPIALAKDPTEDRLLLISQIIPEGSPSSTSILGVDLQTGVRTVLSGDGVGSGPALNRVTAMIAQPGAGPYLLNDGTQLISVDVSTGLRTVLAGQGPPLVQATGMGWSQVSGSIAVVDDAGSLLSIDPLSGDRTVLHSLGSALSNVQGVTIDEALNRVVVVHAPSFLLQLVEFDLATGTQTAVPYTGTWSASYGAGLAVDTIPDIYLVASWAQHGLMMVDRITGEGVHIWH